MKSYWKGYPGRLTGRDWYLPFRHCCDGQDAWNQMKDNPPDILITDIRMPYIDGLELSRLAKDLNPNIVLLIISAYDDFEYARTAMHLRALDYILKPIDLDAMNAY